MTFFLPPPPDDLPPLQPSGHAFGKTSMGAREIVTHALAALEEGVATPANPYRALCLSGTEETAKLQEARILDLIGENVGMMTWRILRSGPVVGVEVFR